ncbi:MAG: phage tail tape measure protein [Rhizobiales bacterium]|nr:phage tail tape measure protein [Hyphomicrobiales bacterium]
MAKLTASMVVDLVDRTGQKVPTILGNLDRLRRAERNYVMADRGVRLSGRDRALERLMIAREKELAERRERTTAFLTRGSMVASAMGVAAGVAAGRAYADFAAVERRMARIGLTADASAQEIASAFSLLQQQAQKVAMPVEKAMGALDTLVASGMNLKDALSFLPSVLATAQASGSETQDIANTALKASSALKISAEQMQAAFDMMLTGTKAGQFELPDMSQYLPELSNSFASLGYEGLDGLRELIAVLQTLREDTGSAGAAATQAQNIFGKMYSEETARRFKKFGKDLRIEMAEARKNGESTIGAFIRLSKEAVNGDMSKLPLLFSDQEFRLGMQSLMTSGDSLARFVRSMEGLRGKDAVFNDLNRILAGSQAKIDKFGASWDSLMTKVGGNVAEAVNPVLDRINKHMDDTSAYAEGLRKTGADDPGTKRAYQRAYAEKYRSMYPDKGHDEWKQAFYKDMMEVGRGLEDNFLDRLKRLQRVTDLYLGNRPARSSTVGPDGERIGITSRPPPGAEFPGGDRHLDSMNLPEHDVPLPSWVSDQLAEEKKRIDEVTRRIMKYPRTVDPASVEEERERRNRDITLRASGAYPDPANDPTPEEDASFMQSLKRFFLGAAADPNFDPRQHFGIKTKAGAADTSAAGGIDMTTTGSVQTVALSGTPTVVTQPSGVQQVQVMNSARPNVTVHMNVTVNEASNVDTIVRQLGGRLQNAIGEMHQGGGDHGY